MKLLKFSISKVLIGILILGFALDFTFTPAHAAGPVDWQGSATGLSTGQNDQQKTAGLGFTVEAESWPFLSLQGGVEDVGSGKMNGPVGIELGQIKIPNSSSATLHGENVDWSTNKMTFSSSRSNLELWVSRLTPALLVHSLSNSLQLLSGDVSGSTFDGSTIFPRSPGPSYPKYVAYSSAGSYQVRTLTTVGTNLPPLDKNWLLLWYGSNSHFVDTKKPLTYTGPEWINASLPQTYAYQADAPILLIFQNQPLNIKHSGEGGVEIAFGSSAGYVTILPMLGRDHPEVSQSELWSQSLPASVKQKTQWWSDNLCKFPIGVQETYSYNGASDLVSITETFSFLNTCAGEKIFAPIPPMLAIAKDSLNVNFSRTVTNANLDTEFGPTMGIENTQTYTWSIGGLKKYTNTKRRLIDSGEAPSQLVQELNSQVGSMISAGHFAPWIFSDTTPRNDIRGDIYWLNPADVLYHLIEIESVLPDEVLKSDFLNYIKRERNTFPPENIPNFPLGAGVVRGHFSVSGSAVYDRWLNGRSDIFLTDVPLYNYYSLARYNELTKEILSTQTWQKAQEALDRDMREHDWATFYWFQGYDDRRISVVNSNRHFAGLVGYIKLSRMVQDQEAEALGRSLLAKAVVLRIGMAKYSGYLYSANLVDLPNEPHWQVNQTAGNWWGHLSNYIWQYRSDDPRQVMLLDQFGVFLADHSGYLEPGTGFRDWDTGATSPYLIAFRDITPELGHLLSDFSKAESGIYLEKVEALFPHWYAAFSEGMLGAEHNVNHPIDSYQVFLAKALVMEESPERLTHYLDIPWLHQGDLFYLHKLAETIKAYKGIQWEN
jgi:hypothetical protein